MRFGPRRRRVQPHAPPHHRTKIRRQHVLQTCAAARPPNPWRAASNPCRQTASYHRPTTRPSPAESCATARTHSNLPLLEIPTQRLAIAPRQPALTPPVGPTTRTRHASPANTTRARARSRSRGPRRCSHAREAAHGAARTGRRTLPADRAARTAVNRRRSGATRLPRLRRRRPNWCHTLPARRTPRS